MQRKICRTFGIAVDCRDEPDEPKCKKEAIQVWKDLGNGKSIDDAITEYNNCMDRKPNLKCEKEADQFWKDVSNGKLVEDAIKEYNNCMLYSK